MKRAIIHLQIQAHELLGFELREPIPTDILKSKGVPIKTVVHIDGEDEEVLCRKIREWIELAKV